MRKVGYAMEATEARTHSVASLKRQKLSGTVVPGDGIKHERRIDRLSERCIDRLSNLPGEILNLILVKLPLKDAVKTSVLCREWRHRWKYLSHLAFEKRFPVEIITSLLRSHEGNIEKLYLPVVPWRLEHNKRLEHEFDSWIDLLSVKGVKDLMVQDHGLRPPRLMLRAEIFTFDSLVHLQIMGCKVELPSSFQGLKRLRRLHLRSVRISNDDFYTLVSSCTNLERLTLEIFFTTGPNIEKNLKISAQNLKELELVYNIDEHIYFENCPSITSIAITGLNLGYWSCDHDYWDFNVADRPDIFLTDDLGSLTSAEKSQLRIQRACGLFKSLGSGFVLRRLSLFGEIFESADMVVMERVIPVICSRLKTLHLHSISLSDQNSIQALHLMLMHSPDLQQLNLWVCYDKHNQSLREFTRQLYRHRIFSLEKLRFLEVRYTHVYEAEQAFEILNLIVASAPTLERFTLRKHGIQYKEVPEKTIQKMVKRLKNVCISPQVTFKHGYEGPPQISIPL